MKKQATLLYGLIIMSAVLLATVVMGQQEKIFRFVKPELWTAAYGQDSAGGGNVTIISQSLVEVLPGLPAVIGELRNDSPNRIGTPSVYLKVYDYSGQLLYIGTQSAVGLSELRPGEKTPFQVNINEESVFESMNNYTLTLEPSSFVQNNPAALRIEVSRQGLTEETYQIIGKVLNYNGTSSTDGVRVIASFYDAAGNYIGSGSAGVVPQTIPVSQASDFIMDAYIGNLTANIESADLAVESLEYLEMIEER
jgi:hypothetical protein